MPASIHLQNRCMKKQIKQLVCLRNYMYDRHFVVFMQAVYDMFTYNDVHCHVVCFNTVFFNRISVVHLMCDKDLSLSQSTFRYVNQNLASATTTYVRAMCNRDIVVVAVEKLSGSILFSKAAVAVLISVNMRRHRVVVVD